MFSPTKSLIRELSKGEEPNWIVSKPKVEENWGARLLTFEDQDERMTAFLAFSADDQWIVSASYGDIIKVWDTFTGAYISSFKDDEQPIMCRALMTDGQNVASVSRNGAINIWSVATDACISALDAFDGEVTSATFSGDGRTLALVFNYYTIRISYSQFLEFTDFLTVFSLEHLDLFDRVSTCVLDSSYLQIEIRHDLYSRQYYSFLCRNLQGTKNDRSTFIFNSLRGLKLQCIYLIYQAMYPNTRNKIDTILQQQQRQNCLEYGVFDCHGEKVD